jgi:N-acetylglucosamine kinase-like BadF-type ATPase
MDFATIAAGVYTVVSPFVVKGLEKIVDEAAKEGYTERKAIWDKVKGLFAQDELTLLNLFKEAETDVKAQGKLEGKIETHLESNHETAKELETLVNTVKEIEKRNVSNLINEDIKNGSEVLNEINQTAGSATENQSSITNRNIDTGKVTNKITQS